MFIECLLSVWQRIGLENAGETSGEKAAMEKRPNLSLSVPGLGVVEAGEWERKEIRAWEKRGGSWVGSGREQAPLQRSGWDQSEGQVMRKN